MNKKNGKTVVAANKVNNSIEVSCRIRYFIANYGQNHTSADCGASLTDSKLKRRLGNHKQRLYGE